VKKNAKRRNWTNEIEKLNGSALGRKWYEMGSPGSAQVSLVRLKSEWNGLDGRTVGKWMLLSIFDLDR